MWTVWFQGISCVLAHWLVFWINDTHETVFINVLIAVLLTMSIFHVFISPVSVALLNNSRAANYFCLKLYLHYFGMIWTFFAQLFHYINKIYVNYITHLCSFISWLIHFIWVFPNGLINKLKEDKSRSFSYAFKLGVRNFSVLSSKYSKGKFLNANNVFELYWLLNKSRILACSVFFQVLKTYFRVLSIL